jgi:hypothetical protein
MKAPPFKPSDQAQKPSEAPPRSDEACCENLNIRSVGAKPCNMIDLAFAGRPPAQVQGNRFWQSIAANSISYLP